MHEVIDAMELADESSQRVRAVINLGSKREFLRHAARRVVNRCGDTGVDLRPAAAGSPPMIVSALADHQAVRNPAFQSRYKPTSFSEDIKTGDVLTSFINDEAARVRDVFAENKIQGVTGRSARTDEQH